MATTADPDAISLTTTADPNANPLTAIPTEPNPASNLSSPAPTIINVTPVHGNLLPSPNPVIECDVYGDGCPWKRLFKECEENALYFFTRLKNKNDEKGKRINRATDSGTWRAQKDKEIFSYGDQIVLIGFKQSFSFMPKTGGQESLGIWVMHEYRLDDCLLDQWNGCAILKDYVLCRIIKKKLIKGGRSNTNCDHEDEDQDQDQVESLLLDVD
ncbi:hypothetical protein EZV62_005468 [Acer yangbiense]|uniref:NAC domain-containing protein n=1 Tax=Acer yangbiense TaxID=1000413 RepID=A0A5C7IMF3_9ROSI|nr:hypothetical protein EZV62_005468 [Acer yangbiense]